MTLIAVIAVLIMCYGNLRGIREAGKTFALPTYLFSGSVVLMIVTGLYREAFGGGLPRIPHQTGMYCVGCHGTAGSGLLTFASLYVLARAFANGGSSLTGIEAVSNSVSALRPPEGRNARQVLVMQGSIVAFLIAGISWFAHVSHATPYASGYPTVLAQEAKVIFGQTFTGQVLFFLVQAGTAAILFTGGNTSFSGFPFLASFVAEDAFLPRWLTKRGHRLVFSNGIIVLTVVSLTLLLAVGATRQRADPVLRDRRLHRLLVCRLRNGQVSPQEQGTRLAAQAGDQRRGRGLHRAGRGDLRGGEVHRGRLARGRGVPRSWCSR